MLLGPDFVLMHPGGEFLCGRVKAIGAISRVKAIGAIAYHKSLRAVCIRMAP